MLDLQSFGQTSDVSDNPRFPHSKQPVISSEVGLAKHFMITTYCLTASLTDDSILLFIQPYKVN